MFPAVQKKRKNDHEHRRSEAHRLHQFQERFSEPEGEQEPHPGQSQQQGKVSKPWAPIRPPSSDHVAQTQSRQGDRYQGGPEKQKGPRIRVPSISTARTEAPLMKTTR